MTGDDKKALLNALKIDRSARAEPSAKPLRWLVLIALVAGVGFGYLLVTLTSDTGAPIEATPAPAAVLTNPSTPSPPRSGSVLDATGYVVARRQATVSAKVTGKVTAVYIEEGMRVEAGQLLARLDDSVPVAQVALVESQLAAARAGLAELDVQTRQARLDLERTRELAARNLASQADLDRDSLTVEGLLARRDTIQREIAVASSNVALQRTQLADLEIRAPFTGIVIAKAAQPGEMISPISAGGGFTRTGICTIVDMDSLEVEVDVNEAYINRVKPEQPVSVALNAYPNEPLRAAVIAIIPAADRTKATVRVRIGLLERNDKVLPDMGVKVAFLDPESAS
jgi:RND family efflux transporter MFP subunit